MFLLGSRADFTKGGMRMCSPPRVDKAYVILYNYNIIKLYKSILIREPLHREIKLFAAKRGISISEVVETALGDITGARFDTPVPQEDSKVVVPRAVKRAIDLKNKMLKVSGIEYLGPNSREGLVKERGELRGDDYV